MNFFYTYIIRCKDHSYYVGHTDNIEKRLAEHNCGFYKGYTTNRLPVELIFFQIFQTRDEAFAQEQKIKGWSRKKKEALIAGEWNKIKEFSKKKF